uniref:Uncharacterized protein n=1 Tax=Tanacetum cinerariifolium TaxID=118510 RepID=A0A6L2M666_TANCI|nr:hypothetical protein [Tanacetum cinerariifolium]
MAESSPQKTSSPEITHKEEPVTLDKPESPNPFLPTSQVDFTFDEITFTTNNEVALLYPSHPNQAYFEAVSDFISKCCLKEAFTRAPNQYKEYLSKVWYTAKTLDDSKVWISSPIRGVRGDIGITTFRNDVSAQYLPHSSGLDQISNKDATILYCLANEVKVDYEKIIWKNVIHKLNKKTREKIVPFPRFLSLPLKHMIPEYKNEELTINPTQVFNLHNLTLKPNQPKEPSFIDHMKTICNLDVHVDSKAPKPSLQTREVPQGKNCGVKSGLRRKRSFKQTSKSTSEDMMLQQIPQLKQILEYLLLRIPYIKTRYKTKSAGDGLKTAHTDSGANNESRADDISLKVKLEDLSDILKDTRSAFFTPDSPPDEPIIVSDTSEEEKEVAKDKDIEATSHDVPKDTSVLPSPSPKLTQIQELMAQSFFNLPSQVSSLQKKLQTLDSLPSLLHNVIDTLNRFATMVANASGATSMNVPSAGRATASPAEGEKNIKDADTKDELFDLLGKSVMTQYYTKKLLFDKYYDKMLKRKKSHKITNCEVLTKKGHITLKIYKENGSDKVISNLKFSDLHLTE